MEYMGSHVLRPELSDDLIGEIAKLLEVETTPLFAERLRRYADRYYNGMLRERNFPTDGQVRKLAGDALPVVDELRELLLALKSSDWLRAIYRERMNTITRSVPTIEGLQRELSGLRKALKAVEKAAPLKTGPKPRRHLPNAVGNVMALFERMTGTRPEATWYKEGDKGHFLPGPSGKALILFFKNVHPALTEATLSLVAKRILTRHRNRPLREMDPISRLEDLGKFDVIVTHTYLGSAGTQTAE